MRHALNYLHNYLAKMDALKGEGGSALSVRGELKLNEPMSKHTSWRVGGPADRFFRPADLDDLCSFLRTLPADEPLTWIGLGSNLLVRDGGIRGTVIFTTGLLNEMTMTGDCTMRIEAGVPCAKVARFAAAHDLVGGEFFAGIPGTMGGALAMNAGAFGGETWPLVERVETVDSRGNRHERTPAEYEIAYRQVSGPAGEWFVAAHLQLKKGDGEASRQHIKELLAKRSATQPTQQPNCGSVFRNPPDDFAARLIEDCGLKGTCIGGACVSEKHANFIVNTGDASAADIEALIEKVRQTVQATHNVLLKQEVHVIGEALPIRGKAV